jgi:hypothetical protein
MIARPRAFLAAAVAGALALVYCPPAPEPVAPDPVAAPPAATWPDFLAAAAAKDRLARDAAAGRRSLVEAAALFRALDGRRPAAALPPPADPADRPLRIPAGTAAGRRCRQVALYAYVALWPQGPGEAAAAVARLEAEFFAEVRAHGELRLPDPAALEPVEELLRQARAWLAAQERRAAHPGPPPAGR